jgi:hypothetical protein
MARKEAKAVVVGMERWSEVSTSKGQPGRYIGRKKRVTNS